jgi:hypothetical protein
VRKALPGDGASVDCWRGASAMKDFQIHRNDIQIFRNEIQAGGNEFQIPRNEIQIQILPFPSPNLAFSMSYADPPRPL